jgi:hypothetical protein
MHGKWINVDYMHRPQVYDFHRGAFERNGPLVQEIRLDGEIYNIHMAVAHPWDILIEKLLSPRFEAEVERGDGMHPDIKQVFLLLRSEGGQEGFWSYMTEKGKMLASVERIEKNLAGVIERREVLGYGGFELPDLMYEKVRGPG